MSIGLSSSDVDYLKDAQTVDVVDLNANDERDLIFSTCDTSKGNTLDGMLALQNSDQFVQFTSQGTNLVDSVCNPVTVTNYCNTTNTVTSTTNILNQVAELKIVDGQQYHQEINSQVCHGDDVLNDQVLAIPTEAITALATDKKGQLKMFSVDVMTNTTNTSQMYVLSMTFDEDSVNANERKAVQEQVQQSILILDKEARLQHDITAMSEPQRSSTPTFDETGLGTLNDTIIDGHISKSLLQTEPLNFQRPLILEKTTQMLQKEDPCKEKQLQPSGVRENKEDKEEMMNSSTAEMEQDTLDEKLLKAAELPKQKTSELNSNEKVNNEKENLPRSVQHSQNVKKQPGAAEILTSKHSSSTKYCSDWVRKNNCVSGEIAQNDTYIEQDTCDSSLLHNVTSVSKNVQNHPKQNTFVSQ